MGWKTFDAPDVAKITFGHNRLSIIDLDPRSNQPFNYFDRAYLVFNGEIYNFQKIKNELSQKGYEFKTTSDTEVICAAYLEYGKNCVNKFVGMFAFVLYDPEQKCLFGARDRMGQKPFYYYHKGTDFEFASQISSIQLFHNELTISQDAISYYLAWGNVPDPFSIFNEIKKLNAGHLFFYDLKSGDFTTEQYWDIDYLGKHKFKASYPEAQNQLEELLTSAVSMRLFADVPVGIFLSGGIDSSLVAALATKTTSERVKTFSVKFIEKGFDESIYAGQVANHLETDHHVIECNYKEGIDLIKNFYRYYDEPFADSSAIPSMLLAKHTREHVTVALSGDGGDESFLGYRRYDINKRLKLYKFPLVLRKIAGSAISGLDHPRAKVFSKALKYRDYAEFYMNSMTGMNKEWIGGNFDHLNIAESKYLMHSNKNILERISDFDIKTYLNWDINTKVDRATMAYSLEARSPLMDHRIVEFAQSLPTEYKFIEGNQKRILKDVLYKHVPEAIFNRPKAGFTMPFAEWFRKELKDYVLSELNENGLNEIPTVRSEKVKFMIDQHMKGEWNHYSAIWRLLILKQWLNQNQF